MTISELILRAGQDVLQEGEWRIKHSAPAMAVLVPATHTGLRTPGTGPTNEKKIILSHLIHAAYAILSTASGSASLDFGASLEAVQPGRCTTLWLCNHPRSTRTHAVIVARCGVREARATVCVYTDCRCARPIVQPILKMAAICAAIANTSMTGNHAPSSLDTSRYIIGDEALRGGPLESPVRSHMPFPWCWLKPCGSPGDPWTWQ
jgi:hypothetical protein